MRVTKVKNIKHFKYKDRGGLILNNYYNVDYTGLLLKNTDYLPKSNRYKAIESSLKCSFLNKKANNPMAKYAESLINFLISEKSEWEDFNKFKEEYSKNSNIKKDIEDSLSTKGMNRPYYINNLLEKLLIVKTDEELLDVCSDTRDKLHKKIIDKRNCLKRSIKGNYLFSINDNKIEYHSKKSEFLGRYMTKIFEDGNYNIFIKDIKKLSKEYSIDNLFKNFEENILSKKDGNNNRVTAIEIKNTLNNYNSSIKNKLKNDDDLSIYSNEVKKYIEHYFPVSKKRNNPNRRNFNKGYIEYYLNKKRLCKIIEKQLINALVQHIIKIGKFVYYYTTNPSGEYIWDVLEDKRNIYFTSTDLENIKKREAFTKKIINTCVFATNNFRNILKPDEQGDILLRFNTILQNSLHNNEEKQKVIKRFKHFLNIGFFDKNKYEEVNGYLNSDKLDILLNESRSSIYFPRNNIYHFRNKSNNNILDYIFNNNDKLGLKDSDGEDIEIGMDNSILNKIFELDKDNVENNFLEKLESSKIFNYYNHDELEKFFNENNIVFSLEYSKVPFAPSFKRIWKRFYDTEKNWLKINDENKTEEKNLAKRNFMKIIYYHLFLHSFTNNTVLFKETVNNILRNNEKNAKNNEWAYKGINKFSDNDKIEDYLSNIQSRIMYGNTKNKPNYFSRFVFDIFKEGFKSYIEKFVDYDFILNPSTDLKNNKIDFKNVIKIKLDIFENLKYHHILFYGLMKLSDSNTVNSLRNEILKYQQATKEDLSIYYAIIQLASLSNNRILTQINNEIENDEKKELFGKNEIFKNFYDDKEEWNLKLGFFADLDNIKNSTKLSDDEKFYFQVDKNGEEVPKIISNLEYIRKYGTFDVLKNINVKKIDSIDIEEYHKASKGIEKLYEEHEKLHLQWVKNHDWAEKEENIRKYKKNIADINKYSVLVNRIKFNNLSEIQRLLIEFLGKMVGYLSIWERDIIFFLLTVSYLKSLNDENSDNFSKQDVLNVFKDGRMRYKYSNLFLRNNQDIKNKILSPLLFNENEDEIFNYRNSINHLDFLKNNNNKSILEYLKEIRFMLSYDRKLKNSVTKSFIQIAERHKIKLSFDFKYNNPNHDISIEKIETMKNYHLDKNKNVGIPSRSEDFIGLVEQLFEYGKNESTFNS